MADSLGEGSERGIFDQSLAGSCSMQISHRLEVEVWLDRGMLVLCSTTAMSLEINLLQKQGLEDCEKERKFAVFLRAPKSTKRKRASGATQQYSLTLCSLPTGGEVGGQNSCTPFEAPNWSIWAQIWSKK